jgi:hypothetical protein
LVLISLSTAMTYKKKCLSASKVNTLAWSTWQRCHRANTTSLLEIRTQSRKSRTIKWSLVIPSTSCER